jgi:hypothetical protein
LAGAISGLAVGAVLFGVTEVLVTPSDAASAALAAGLRAGLLGSFWAAPLAVVVGALFGLTVLAMGRVVGVVEPAWQPERPQLRAAVLATILGSEVLAALALRAWGT